jgi:hypothetical protein
MKGEAVFNKKYHHSSFIFIMVLNTNGWDYIYTTTIKKLNALINSEANKPNLTKLVSPTIKGQSTVTDAEKKQVSISIDITDLKVSEFLILNTSNYPILDVSMKLAGNSSSKSFSNLGLKISINIDWLNKGITNTPTVKDIILDTKPLSSPPSGLVGDELVAFINVFSKYINENSGLTDPTTFDSPTNHEYDKYHTFFAGLNKFIAHEVWMKPTTQRFSVKRDVHQVESDTSCIFSFSCMINGNQNNDIGYVDINAIPAGATSALVMERSVFGEMIVSPIFNGLLKSENTSTPIQFEKDSAFSFKTKDDCTLKYADFRASWDRTGMLPSWLPFRNRVNGTLDSKKGVITINEDNVGVTLKDIHYRFNIENHPKITQAYTVKFSYDYEDEKKQEAGKQLIAKVSLDKSVGTYWESNFLGEFSEALTKLIFSKLWAKSGGKWLDSADKSLIKKLGLKPKLPELKDLMSAANNLYLDRKMEVKGKVTELDTAMAKLTDIWAAIRAIQENDDLKTQATNYLIKHLKAVRGYLKYLSNKTTKEGEEGNYLTATLETLITNLLLLVVPDANGERQPIIAYSSARVALKHLSKMTELSAYKENLLGIQEKLNNLNDLIKNIEEEQKKQTPDLTHQITKKATHYTIVNDSEMFKFPDSLLNYLEKENVDMKQKFPFAGEENLWLHNMKILSFSKRKGQNVKVEIEYSYNSVVVINTIRQTQELTFSKVGDVRTVSVAMKDNVENPIPEAEKPKLEKRLIQVMAVVLRFKIAEGMEEKEGRTFNRLDTYKGVIESFPVKQGIKLGVSKLEEFFKSEDILEEDSGLKSIAEIRADKDKEEKDRKAITSDGLKLAFFDMSFPKDSDIIENIELNGAFRISYKAPETPKAN